MARKPLSAKKIIKILVKDYGFSVVSQRGSHIKLKCGNRVTVVPNHYEVALGTFRNVLWLAGIEEKDFWSKVK